MYRAKEGGRGEGGSGTYRIFDPKMDQAAQAALQLKLELRGALANSEFRLHFQPIVSVKERRVSAFEALIRWQHPSRGLVPPMKFIPMVETTSYIVPIGDWVLRQACREATRWPDDIKVAVNLSPVQFQRGDIVATVVNALAQTQLAAEPARTRNHRDGPSREVGAKHRARCRICARSASPSPWTTSAPASRV